MTSSFSAGGQALARGRGKFAARLKGSPKKQHTARAFAAKVEIRERVLAWVGMERASVFDAFAGAGELHRAVWSRAAHYEGCDRDLSFALADGRTLFCADNRRVLRCIDLARFNIFDLDAHGSPWEQAMIVAARRPVQRGERIGLALTLGEGLTLKLGNMPLALASLAGFARGVPGALRNGEIAERAIRELARRMGCRIAHRWQAEGKGGSAMRYVGLAMEGERIQET
jgi:hypothetical protein